VLRTQAVCGLSCETATAGTAVWCVQNRHEQPQLLNGHKNDRSGQMQATTVTVCVWCTSRECTDTKSDDMHRVNVPSHFQGKSEHTETGESMKCVPWSRHTDLVGWQSLWTVRIAATRSQTTHGRMCVRERSRSVKHTSGGSRAIYLSRP